LVLALKLEPQPKEKAMEQQQEPGKYDGGGIQGVKTRRTLRLSVHNLAQLEPQIKKRIRMQT
jgi:hypothetical protein